MPKIVDHAARREEIAEALWRVVRRDGIRAASVRTIAAEAGWSAGAVRYYFPDQDGLLSFAMDLVSRRVTERVEVLAEDGLPRYYAKTGRAQLAIVVCSGRRLGPGVWEKRTIWFASPRA